MSKIKTLLNYFNNITYLKVMCCISLVAGLSSLYYYKVTVPYNKLEKEYKTLKVECDKLPSMCMDAGSNIIQTTLDNKIDAVKEEVKNEPGKIKTEGNVTTFTFSN